MATGDKAAKPVRAASKVAQAAANGTADAAEAVEGTSATDAMRQVSEKSGTLGMGFMGLALSLWSGAYAYSKFRQALGKGPILPEPPQ